MRYLTLMLLLISTNQVISGMLDHSSHIRFSDSQEKGFRNPLAHDIEQIDEFYTELSELSATFTERFSKYENVFRSLSLSESFLKKADIDKEDLDALNSTVLDLVDKYKIIYIDHVDMYGNPLSRLKNAHEILHGLEIVEEYYEQIKGHIN